MTRSLSFLLCAAIVYVLCSSCGGGSSKEVPATPAAAPVVLSIEARLAGRPAWLNSGDSLKAADFANDPHSFACATCHGRPDMTDKEWKATCSGSSCHFRAWPKTQMHRVELATFNRCENCHKPHVFRLNGKDCLSCHGNMGTVAVKSIPGAPDFPHARHKELPCALCHESETTHATLTIKSMDTCQGCHHDPWKPKSCDLCHTAAEIKGPHLEPLTLSIASTEEPRKLPFDHDFHEGIDCAECHEKGVSAAPKIVCTTCHEYHHQPDADCANCHKEPPAGVHKLNVHEAGCTGSGCHGTQGFPAMEFSRNFCESCHRDRSDHNPGKNCVSCHRIAPTPGGGN